MQIDRYREAISKHPFNYSEREVKEICDEIIKKNFVENCNGDVYKKIYSCIDLTSLNSDDNDEKIVELVKMVNDLEGSDPKLPNVASICVFPTFVETIKDILTADIRIDCVAGGFPSGQTFTEVKIAEAALAVSDGAEEIDMVMNIGDFISGNYESLCDEIIEIKDLCKDAKLKVIIESGILNNLQDIHKACILAAYSGADFIKTSTGKGYPGASKEAVFVMCHAIKSIYERNKIKVGIKVSGGVSTLESAIEYYTIVKSILGEEWCDKSLLRIGSSSLETKLRNEIVSMETKVRKE